jgi:four helix bundle protein
MQEESDRDKKYDLEKRLIDFAVRIIDLVETLANTRAGNHIAGQLVRCGTSPAPNYGEAQSAESRNDFIHKIKIVLKELRETKIWLQIIHRKRMARSGSQTESLIAECDELISIFVTSVRTAEKNKRSTSGKS